MDMCWETWAISAVTLSWRSLHWRWSPDIKAPGLERRLCRSCSSGPSGRVGQSSSFSETRATRGASALNRPGPSTSRIRRSGPGIHTSWRAGLRVMTIHSATSSRIVGNAEPLPGRLGAPGPHPAVGGTCRPAFGGTLWGACRVPDPLLCARDVTEDAPCAAYT